MQYCYVIFSSGALYDATGNYNLAFHCAGVPILSGAALLFFMPWAQRTSRGPNLLSSMTTDITVQVGLRNTVVTTRQFPLCEQNETCGKSLVNEFL